MKICDIVKITAAGRWNLNHSSRFVGIIVEAKKPGGALGMNQVVYVSWPDKTQPTPISVKWLEKINESR